MTNTNPPRLQSKRTLTHQGIRRTTTIAAATAGDRLEIPADRQVLPVHQAGPAVIQATADRPATMADPIQLAAITQEIQAGRVLQPARITTIAAAPTITIHAPVPATIMPITAAATATLITIIAAITMQTTAAATARTITTAETQTMAAAQME